MPVIYRCKNCGTILYRFDRVGDPWGVRTPSEVIAMLGGRCPRCGRRLEPPKGIDDIKISCRTGR